MDINNDNISHHRTTRKISTVHSPSGDIQIESKVITNYLTDGSIETVEYVESHMESGENIFHISAYKGQCVLCDNRLTIWTIFRCYICRKVICPECSKKWEETKPVCPSCYKELKKKRRREFIWNLLISPFVSKVEKQL